MIRIINAALLILVSALMLHGEDVQDIIKKVQKKYDKMENFTATFRKLETYKITGSELETVAKIYVKNGRKYRFESEDQVFVTDGDTLWSYNDISRQLIIDMVDKERRNSAALLPRDMLFKYPKTHHATLLDTREMNGKDVYVIKLTPKENTRGYLKDVKLLVEDGTWRMVRIETTDHSDNTTQYEIMDVDSNTKLPDSLFSYQAGEGVEVVDMR